MIIIKKKILLILAVILMGFGTLYRPALADSGWDSDYDSGGSWDSGSDWDSSSSWDSGSDWDSSSSWSSGGSSISGSGGGISLVAVIIVVVIIVVVVSKNGGNKGGGSSNISNSINGSNNISNYKDIQTAWMNFDTDTIRKLTTDEIYNMYSSQLETLKLKKQRNIMKDIELIDVKIIDIHKENDVITIDAYLNVKCYDYVIKDATGEVTRGTDKSKMNIKYKLSFVKSASNNNTEEKCPNCGAPVDIVSSAVCPYCDSTLVKDAGDYVMSKKVSLGQTLER